MYPPDYPAFWGTVDVLPDARRQGIGDALLTAISEEARSAGKTELQIPANDSRPEGIEFLLHRGFREYERAKAVELPLAGLTAPAVELPGRHRAAHPRRTPGPRRRGPCRRDGGVRRHPGRQHPDGGRRPGRIQGSRRRSPFDPEGSFFVATDARPAGVVGYASLLMLPGQANRKAWHDMTAVLRAWRGRGLATALKHATIGWAIDARPRDPADRQRHRQRADAGRQCPARLPADAGPAGDARPAVRRHHGSRMSAETTPAATLPPDPEAYDSVARPARASHVASPRRTSPAGGIPSPRPAFGRSGSTAACWC